MASIAKRYSDALFLAAKDEGVIEAVEQDMALLSEALFDRDVRLFLANPSRSSSDKLSSLEKALGAEERKAAPCTLRFLKLVFQKGRQEALGEMTRSFRKVVLANRGEVEGRVDSFSELDDGEVQGLEESLGKQLGLKVNLTSRVDASLLGGLRVHVGDRMWDSSLRGQLESLNKKLKGVSLPLDSSND